MRTVFLFPGQGSVYPGMGRDLCREWERAREVYRDLSALAGVDLFALSSNASRAQLNAVANSHLAIVVHSLAVMEVLAGAGIRPDLLAGHSLGHFSALIAAEAMDRAEGVALVKLRGELLEECCDRRPGRMLAVRGVRQQRLEEVVGEALQGPDLCIANVNGRDEIVVSGALDAIGRAGHALREQRIAFRMLPVTGAFHSPLVREAAVALADRIAELGFRRPRCPVVSTGSGRLLTSAGEIRRDLRSHMTRPVRWDAVLETLSGCHADRWIEVGPGKVLTGLALRWKRSAPVSATTDGRALGRLLARVEAAG